MAETQPARGRKRWIIGLSIAALWCTYTIASDYTMYRKAFIKADGSATGYVVEVDPGEPSHAGGRDDDGDSVDPGQEPSSHYQFAVNGTTYEGWMHEELGKSQHILIRYNSSDPSF